MINAKRILITTILLLSASFFSIKLFPNGGTFGSALKSSGNILLKNTPNVNLISEKLFIKPVGDYVHVDVKYELDNTGDEIEVNYGFPFYQLLNTMGFSLSFNDELNKSVKYFIIKLNGNTIKTGEKIDEGSDAETLWYIAKLKLKKGINILNITYASQPYFEDLETSKSPLIEYGKRQFIYNFRPAGTWGNGTLCNLDITVDSINIINKKGSINLSGFAFSKEANRYYKASMKDIDLKISNMLTITYDNSKYHSEINKILYNFKKTTCVETIKSSSILKDVYSPQKLLDADFSTAWAEGTQGCGINESISIKFKDSSDIKSLHIINGYQKSAETYLNNSRIKKLKLEMLISAKNNAKSEIKEIELLDYNKKDFDPMYGSDFEKNIRNRKQALISPDDFDYEYSIKSVKITILEVYPGTKYEDTCISEIIAF